LRIDIIMKEILRHWGMTDAVITPMDYTSGVENAAWDVDGRFVLQRKRPEDLTRSIDLTQFLTQRGVPVVTYLPTTAGDFVSPCGQYCLANKVSGEHVSLLENPQLAATVGHELARLHLALAELPPEFTIRNENALNNWHSWVLPNLDDDFPAEILTCMEIWLRDTYPKLPHQPIHRDAHMHNALFDIGTNRLLAWLDFDIACRGARVFDIAYLLGGLLVDKQNDASQVQVWHDVCRGVKAAYSAVSPLTKDEYDGLYNTIILVELYFAAFWQMKGKTAQVGSAKRLALWLYNN